jgi:hypothetical protein
MTQRHLNRAAASMSALSPIAGELRAFSMNDTDSTGGGQKRLAIKTDPIRGSVAIDGWQTDPETNMHSKGKAKRTEDKAAEPGGPVPQTPWDFSLCC